MTRQAQARLLLRPLWRAGTWRLAPACTAAVVGATALLRLAGADVRATMPVVVGGFLVAAATGFALDDDAANIVAPSPSPPAFRTGLRLAVAYAVAAACWAGLLAYSATFAAPVAVARPTLLVATLVTVGLLAASAWGGVAAGPAALAFLAAAAELPDGWTLLDPGAAAGRRLALVLAAALLALSIRSARDRTGY